MGALRVLHAEARRLFHRRAAWFTGMALCAVAFLGTWSNRLAASARHGAMVRQALIDGREAPPPPPPENAYGPWLDGWAAGAPVATLLLLVLAARSLAGDVESGLARQALVRGASRAHQVLGRALLGLGLVPAFVVLTGLGSFVGAAVFFAFGDLRIDGALVLTEAEMRGDLPLAVLSLLPPLFAAWCFGLFVSSIARTGVTALVATLLPFLAFDLFKEALGEFRTYVFASFTPSLIDKSNLRETAGVVRGFFDKGYGEDLLRANFVVPLPQALLLIALALVLHARRPL